MTYPPSQPRTNLSRSFSGIHGQARLDWVVVGVAYTANIQTFGSTGVAKVRFFSPVRGCNVIVRENLRLKYYQGNWFYIGFNPKWAHNGFPALYSPDAFKLVPSPMGGVSIVEVCDRQWGCTPITTTPLR